MLNYGLLEQYNPWWQEKPIPKQYQFKTSRFQLEKLKKQAFETGIVTTIVGPRRIGKTILLYQLIEWLLGKIPPKRIIFLKADDPSLTIEENLISDLVNTIETILISHPITELKEPIIVILDEIQATPLWAEYLKKYIDLGVQIKFIVSGSASINIVKTTKESLSGRANEIIIGPLAFREVFNWALSDTLPKLDTAALYKKESFLEATNNIWHKFSTAQNATANMFEQYLVSGGFPKVVDEQFVKQELYSQEETISYLKTQVIERVLFRDIPELTGLKNTFVLQQLFTLLAHESGGVSNFREIGRKFSTSYTTIQTHLWYLHQAYLITMLRKYSRGGMAQARTQPKIHLTDTGVMASLLNMGSELLQDPKLTGRFVETNLVSTFRFGHSNAELFFWRDQRNEIDLILSKSNNVIPIEVKYRNHAIGQSYASLLEFAKKYNSSFPLVITKNEYSVSDSRGILFLPAWFFLLMV